MRRDSGKRRTLRSVVSAGPEPLAWPVATKLRPGIRSFAGHTDTVLDVVGRIGTPPSLVIFTEGNHLMVLLDDDIVGAFPSWAKSRRRYADLDLGNIVVATLPQPVLVRMIRTGGIVLGNLTLDVSRESGFYPDIFMGYPGPLRQLHKLGVIEPQARFFSKNRGLALLVRKGNPLGIHGLADAARTRTRIALSDSGMFVPSAVLLPTSCSESPPPTPSSRRRCRAFQVASVSCIAIFPRWSPADMRTSPSRGITSFPIGHGYSQITSRSYECQVASASS